jgi:hypothetical protein
MFRCVSTALMRLLSTLNLELGFDPASQVWAQC